MRVVTRSGWASSVLAFAALGCGSTVASAHPHASAYAREEVPGRYQPDVRVVLAMPDDAHSRAALGCILAFAHGVRARDARVDAARGTSVGGRLKRAARPPPMPDATSSDDVEGACRRAEGSDDTRLAEIGRRYGIAARTDLSPEALREAVGFVVLDDVEALLREGNDNLAYRKLQALLASGARGSVAERAGSIVAEHHRRLAMEETFEAGPEVRLLRRQERTLEDEIRSKKQRGEVAGRLAEELRDARDELTRRHDAFVTERGARE